MAGATVKRVEDAIGVTALHSHGGRRGVVSRHLMPQGDEQIHGEALSV